MALAKKTCLGIPTKHYFSTVQQHVSTPSESPNNNWGANWPGGLTDPSCPGEEDR